VVKKGVSVRKEKKKEKKGLVGNNAGRSKRCFRGGEKKALMPDYKRKKKTREKDMVHTRPPKGGPKKCCRGGGARPSGLEGTSSKGELGRQAKGILYAKK